MWLAPSKSTDAWLAVTQPWCLQLLLMSCETYSLNVFHYFLIFRHKQKMTLLCVPCSALGQFESNLGPGKRDVQVVLTFTLSTRKSPLVIRSPVIPGVQLLGQLEYFYYNCNCCLLCAAPLFSQLDVLYMIESWVLGVEHFQDCMFRYELSVTIITSHLTLYEK